MNNKNNNNKSNIPSITDPILTKLLIGGIRDKTTIKTTKSSSATSTTTTKNNNKYISAIKDPNGLNLKL